MTPHPSVLLSLRDRAWGETLDGWMRGYGYRTRLSADPEETISWLSRESFSASFLDSEMEARAGEPVWRIVRPGPARRVVLMTSQSARERKDLWFEALRYGVATVLPLPPAEEMVRAALAAVSLPATTHTTNPDR